MRIDYLKYLLILFFASSVYSQNDSIIKWNENSKLDWSDFKIKKGFDSRKNRNYIAETSAGFMVEYELNDYYYDNKINVYAVFNKYNSSYSLRTDYLLEHEQLHFDIVELFARNLRKEYYENFKNLDEKSIISIYKKQKKLLNDYQDLYDSETNHSNEKEKQKEWNNKIRNELLKSKDFSFDNYLSKIDTI